jgi:Tfp pilus assembly major pilin PilA
MMVRSTIPSVVMMYQQLLLQCLLVVIIVCGGLLRSGDSLPVHLPESTSSARTTSTTISTTVPSSIPNLPTTTRTSESTAKILESIHEEYIREMEQGFATFGTFSERVLLDTAATTASEESVSVWSDTDFQRYHVGTGNAGPDETVLSHGHEIFQTIQPIISPEECAALILEAKQVIAAAGGDKNNEVPMDMIGSTVTTNTTTSATATATTAITNSQLGEARVSQLPITRQWLQRVLHTRFFPLLSSRFGIPAHDITLQDGLIIGYGYQSKYGSRSQPIHRDSCLLSLNVALSSTTDYTDGGTFFEGLTTTPTTTTTTTTSDGVNHNGIITTERGHVTCHAGGIPHAGRSIGPNGERWVLVLFCIVRGYPEYARRCHAQGMMERTNQHPIQVAKDTFQAGLSFAPQDHLLLTSLGSIYMEEKNELAARTCLALAAQGYDHCMKANMALGRMMLTNRKPRAALRRFDAVLERLQDRDLLDGVWDSYRAVGFDARYYGAQAALISAREAKRQGDGCTFDWRHHVNVAMDRCNIALRSAPEDNRILGMLGFAENLLTEE